MMVYRLKLRMHIISVVIFIIFLFLLVLEHRWFQKTYLIILAITSFASILDIFRTSYIVEGERLIVKALFRTRYLYWNEIKSVMLSPYNKKSRITIWLLRDSDFESNSKSIINYSNWTTITIPWLINDNKSLIREILNKCKDNRDTMIGKGVLELIN